MNYQVILEYLVHHWPAILNYSIDGLSLAVILQCLKRRTKIDQAHIKFLGFIKLDGPKIVTLMLTIFSGIMTAENWLLDPSNAQYIPQKYAFLLTAAFYFHRFLVSPAAIKLGNWLRPYIQAVQLVNSTYNAAAPKSIYVPAPPVSAMTPPSVSPPTPAPVVPPKAP